MQASTAILLVQTGTPREACPAAVREYLTEFLNDPFVIHSRGARWIIKHLLISCYAKKTAEKYARFFNGHGRTLTDTSNALASKLEQMLNNTRVVSAMRYGEPSLERVLNKLVHENISQILIIPLFPQFSRTTTGSIINHVSHILPLLSKKLSVSFIEHFYHDPHFIDCLTAHINSHLDKDTEHLFLSYHSLPTSYVRKGDPYVDQCVQTTNLLKQKINLPADKISHVYQSRMGWGQWQGPFLKDELEQITRQGVKKVAVAFPGFTFDCLETLDEVGGMSLQLIPCLNDSDQWANALEQIITSKMI